MFIEYTEGQCGNWNVEVELYIDSFFTENNFRPRKYANQEATN